MKIYDIAHLVPHGEYLEFPYDIPIPCDLQVERVSQTSGLTTAEEPDRIMDAWATVMETVSEEVGHHISLLRIDSIVWQSGQIIGNHEPDQKAAQDALIRHFVEQVEVDRQAAETLAHELTAEM
jgi:N-glycosylase/DNA lyase